MDIDLGQIRPCIEVMLPCESKEDIGEALQTLTLQNKERPELRVDEWTLAGKKMTARGLKVTYSIPQSVYDAWKGPSVVKFQDGLAPVKLIKPLNYCEILCTCKCDCRKIAKKLLKRKRKLKREMELELRTRFIVAMGMDAYSIINKLP